VKANAAFTAPETDAVNREVHSLGLILPCKQQLKNNMFRFNINII